MTPAPEAWQREYERRTRSVRRLAWRCGCWPEDKEPDFGVLRDQLSAAQLALDAHVATAWEVEREPEACEWTPDTDGIWDTGCGLHWFFDTGDVGDNGVRFCFGCGKPVVADAAAPGGEREP